MQTEQAYFVIGRDSKQYGPVPVPTLGEWILSDLISLDSPVWAQDQQDWAPLKEVIVREPTDRSASLTRDQQEFAIRLKNWLKRKGYEVGPQNHAVDSRLAALAASGAASALKYAVGHLANQPVHARTRVKGVKATSEALEQAVSPLLPIVDLIAVRNGLLYVPSAVFAVFADELTVVEILGYLDLMANTGFRLSEFAVATNGQQNFFVKPLFLYFDSRSFESHLSALMKAGLQGRYGGTRSSVTQACFVDVPRRIIKFKPEPGFLGRIKENLGVQPFKPGDLNQVLGTPLE
jgi:hypothetical protein